LDKDKESAKLPQFTAHQLAIPAVHARIQRWLVLGLPGARGGCTTTGATSKVQTAVNAPVAHMVVLL